MRLASTVAILLALLAIGSPLRGEESSLSPAPSTAPGAAAPQSGTPDPAAPEQDATLALEIILNGRPTGTVGAFTLRGGVLLATRAELHDVGFIVPAGAGGGVDPIPLSEVPGLKARLDMRKQALAVTAEDSALLPTEFGPGSTMHLAPLTQPGFGGVLTYDIAGTRAGGTMTGGSLIDARAFSPYGVVESTGLTQFSPVQGEQAFTRLDTTYTYSDEDDLRRWRAGDVISGALAWTRSVRLGGGQVARDFSLRPDLITYPYPAISSSAALPSSVDLFVNGLRQSTESVEPGPFAIRSLPLVTGAGEITATATDALGRQTTTTLPLYVSTLLLQPGLSSYSLEVGSVRQLYGLTSDTYAGWAGSGSLRYGVTDWLTLESHAEAASDLGLAGIGADIRVFTLGTLNAAIAGSDGGGKSPYGALPGTVKPPPNGGLVSLGVQRQSRQFNISLLGTYASPGFRDIAAVNGSPVPRSSLTASVGFPLGDFGTVGLAWINQRGGKPSVATAPLRGGSESLYIAGITAPGAVDFSIATASYSLPLTQSMGLYATAFADLSQSRNYGAVVGLSFFLGNNISASSSAARQNRNTSAEVDANKSVFQQNDWGFLARDSEGYSKQRAGELDYLSPFGFVSAGVAQAPGAVAERAEWRGSLAYAGGTLAMGDAITDSFAVVRTGDVSGVPVLSQNQPYGTTGARGTLLVPNLASYQNNTLAIDPTALPADVEVDRSHVILRPTDRSGVVVDFGVRRVNAALLTLHDTDGKPIPVGSVARVEGGEPQPVGFDGQAYLTGLKAHNRVEIELAGGHRCAVEFDYQAEPGEIPAIGPLTCK
jgi:outer membrane usher protein